MRMRELCLVLLGSGIVACGDDGPSQGTPDARIMDDAPNFDAMSACDYLEADDAGNDTVDGGGTAEQTGITFGTRSVICGAFEHTHFDGDITVDIDAYHVSLAADTDIIVRIAGAGAETIQLVGIDIYGGAAFDQLVGIVTFYGDHGAAAMRLPAGTYEFVPFALHSEALAQTVHYRIEITADMPATRCVELTTGGYAEAGDGAANNGNDVIEFPSGPPPRLTTSPDDMAEATGIVLQPGASARITGEAADVPAAFLYKDVDTYAFATNTGTNEITMLLTWSGTANLNVHLFEVADPLPVQQSISTATEIETELFSVKPSASYWVLVGADAGAGGLPTSYSLTMCGASYAP